MNQVPGDEAPWWSQPLPTSTTPATSTPAMSTTPLASARPKLPILFMLALALVAGVLGGGVGYFAAQYSDDRVTSDVREPFTNTSDGRALTTSTSTIERAPGSIAGIAARVLPSVVSISIPADC